MRKLLALIWKEVYLTFTDRSLLVIMLISPLAISTIVGLAFGGLGDGQTSAFSNIPVAVVNLDAGTEQQGQTFNYGQDFVSVLIPGTAAEGESAMQSAPCPLVDDAGEEEPAPFESMALDDLFNAEELTDIEAGRAAVESGDYAALIIVPEDFSARMAPVIDPFGSSDAADTETTAVEVYANSGSPVSAAIVQSVVQGFTDQMLTGNIAIGAAVNTMIAENPIAAMQLSTNEDAGAIFGCAFTGALNTISIDQIEQTEFDDEDGNQFAFSLTTGLLVQIGSAQAVLFALFTGQFGVVGIIEERRTFTLQRMIVSPTQRLTILAGNLLGTFVTVVFQISLILLALMGIASLVEGQIALIWGTNIFAVLVLVVSLGMATAALGVLFAGIAKTSEQVGIFGTVFNMIMGVLGGAFGFQVGPPLSYISLIYWGVDGFSKLAVGSTDIWLNVLVLVGQAVVLFAVGVWIFNRRLDI